MNRPTLIHSGTLLKKTVFKLMPVAARHQITRSVPQRAQLQKRMPRTGVKVPAIRVKIAAWSRRCNTPLAVVLGESRWYVPLMDIRNTHESANTTRKATRLGLPHPRRMRMNVRTANTPAPKRCDHELTGSLKPGTE